MPRAKQSKKTSAITNLEVWIIIIAAAFMAVGLIYYSQKILDRELSINTQSYIKMTTHSTYAWIEVNFGNNQKRRFQSNINEKTTLLSAIINIAKEHNISYSVKNGNLQDFAGKKNNVKKWRTYKNKELMSLTLDRMLIAQGDQYTLRYE